MSRRRSGRPRSHPADLGKRTRSVHRPATGADLLPGKLGAWEGNRRSQALAICLLSLAVLVCNASYYYPFLADDALISLRYVQRFLQGHGLTWTDGKPVEGYSNFLWMMMAAALGATGIDLIRGVQVLGFLAVAAVVPALCYGFLRGTRRSAVCVAIGSLLWVLSGPAGAWAMAGMEPPLVACLLTWSLVLLIRSWSGVDSAPRRWLLSGFLLGCLCLTRPDGPLFAPVIGAWVLLEGRFRNHAWRRFAWLSMPPLFMTLGQLLFRRAYYGEWLPNVAYVKISPSTTHLVTGLHYVANGLASLRPLTELSLLAIGFLCAKRPTRSLGILLLSLSAAWLGYLCLMGGDIFGAWRHLVPVLLFFVIADLLALESLKAGWVSSTRKWGPVAVLLFGWYVYNQFTNERNVWAKKELWTWNGRLVGTTLKHGFATQKPLLAVTAAGGVPYWSELPCLDLLGLNDHTIARTRPTGWGTGWVGHEVGDSRYVLSLQPDLILFGTPGGSDPTGIYARDMPDLPEFRDNYDLCNFAATFPSYFNSRMWVRRTSPKIGLRSSRDEIFVPPYLLNLSRGAITKLTEQDRFYVTVSPDLPVGIAGLEMAAGCWRRIEPQQHIRMRIVDPDSSAALEERSLNGLQCVMVPRAGKYIVVLESTGADDVPIYGLRLVRE